MSILTPDSQKVLQYYYDNKGTSIGINKVRDFFHFTDDQIYNIERDLEGRGFITTTPNYPLGTARTYAPKNLSFGTQYEISIQGIHYIDKQGDFKDTKSNTYNNNNTISNSPKTQVVQFSDYSYQNISDNEENNKNEESFEKMEELTNQMVELQKELSKFQEVVNESITKKDKNIIEKFLSTKPFKFIGPDLKINFPLDNLLDATGLSTGV